MSPSADIQAVISVFPDLERSQLVGTYLQEFQEHWIHIPVTGSQAQTLLDGGSMLRFALGRATRAIRLGKDLQERLDFSQQVFDTALRGLPQGRYLVLAPSLVPLDLVRDEDGNWGERSIFSHLLVGNESPMSAWFETTLSAITMPLSTYLLVCPMKMDRPLPPRYLQDIVTVALAFENDLPVEVWLQPPLTRTVQGLTRNDVCWLHIDTHGSWDGKLIMLYPTREGGQLNGSDILPETITIPFVMLVGCSLTASHESIGQELVRRGVKAVFGPCTVFQSLALANTTTRLCHSS